ncbi:MAG: hypothetical protein H7Y60_02505 [Rhodospirillaceae bacterium]|nr:hypothetical protein [Rhodospirillales bacterium]
MTEEEALAALADARADKKGWLRIAELLEAVRASDIGGKQGKLSVAFIDAAAKASRYAPAILRRMSTARAFLFDFDRQHPGLRLLDRLDGSTAQFSKVEILARLYKIAPERALEIAGQIAEGALRTKDVEQIYREAMGLPQPVYLNADPFGGVPAFPQLKAPVSKLRRLFPTPFHQACWEALKRDVDKLSGEGDVRLSCDFRFTYFNPFAIAVGVKEFGIGFVDGFYPALLSAEPSRAELNRVLRDVAFQSPFFRRFWVLTPGAGGAAAIMSDELTASGLVEIGCAELRDGSAVTKRNVTAMTAIRQQAKLAEEVLEVGVPRG